MTITTQPERRDGVWIVSLGHLQFGRFGRQHRLVLQPYPRLNSAPELRAWIEQTQYCHQVNFTGRKPTATQMKRASLREVTDVVKNTHRTILLTHRLHYLVVDAIARGDLTGPSANEAMHHLFEMSILRYPHNFDFICKHAGYEVIDNYSDYLAAMDDEPTDTKDLQQARTLIRESVYDGQHTSRVDCSRARAKLRAWYAIGRCHHDADFRDAIILLGATEESCQKVATFLAAHITIPNYRGLRATRSNDYSYEDEDEHE